MVWNRDDLTAGLVFLGIGALLGGNALLFLPLGTVADMGPGFFPLVLCVILALLGASILLNARRRAGVGAGRGEDPGEERAPVNLRAVVLITAAPVAFGLALRGLGLVPALLLALGLALAASRTIGLARGAAIAGGMTVFCVGVFYYGLRVPVELLNPTLFQ